MNRTTFFTVQHINISYFIETINITTDIQNCNGMYKY